MSKKYKILSILLFFTMITSLFGNSLDFKVQNNGPTIKIDPYSKNSDETPSWLKNLRRAEIVSLGSLPFTTLSTTLGYSLIKGFSNGFRDGFPNPMAKDKNAFNSNEQLGIFFTSLGISVLIGLIDYGVSTWKDKNEEKQQKVSKEEQDRAVILEVK